MKSLFAALILLAPIAAQAATVEVGPPESTAVAQGTAPGPQGVVNPAPAAPAWAAGMALIAAVGIWKSMKRRRYA